MADKEVKYTISFMNGAASLVVRGDDAKQMGEDLAAILPVFKRFKEVTTPENQVAPTTTPQGPAPHCGVHGVLMVWKTGNSKTTGKPYAFWSCPAKNADGSYCKFKP